MSYDFEINDVLNEKRKKDKYGTLTVECDPIFEDGDFDAYNEIGILQSFGLEQKITGIKVYSAFFEPDGNTKPRSYHEAELLEEYPWIEEYLIERLEREL